MAAQASGPSLPADPTCLSRAPPYFAALGEAVQASAAQACGGNAGTPLAKAVADAPTVMAQAGKFLAAFPSHQVRPQGVCNCLNAGHIQLVQGQCAACHCTCACSCPALNTPGADREGRPACLPL